MKKITNRKFAAVSLAVGLAAVMTATSAFALNGEKTTKLISDENGTRYSVDEGKTWIEGDQKADLEFEYADNLDVNVYTETFTDGEPADENVKADVEVAVQDSDIEIVFVETLNDGEAAENEEADFIVDVTDGKVRFSSDGGITWTDGAPDGMTIA
jgi:hypothetical protein